MIKKMKIVGLISGGKDSIYNMLQCIAAGHEIVAIANIEPDSKDELDSYMFQSVGHEVISLIHSCLGLPLFRFKTKGQAFCKNKVYIKTLEDEVEDLFELLSKVQKNIDIDGVSVGAIASDYQRIRAENVCSRLGLVCFAYLWKRDQAELLEEMINAQINAIIIKVACIGLNPNTHLGMSLREIQPHLLDLQKKYGVNVCGEGGEYETLTVDCPLYNRLIKITDAQTIVLSNDSFAPVGFLYTKKATSETKDSKETNDPSIHYSNNLKVIQSTINKPYDYIQDCFEENSEIDYKSHYENLTGISHSKQENSEADFNDIKFVSSYSINCQISFSSGWCCIGNVTGTTEIDAFLHLQSRIAKEQLEKKKYDFHDVVFVNLYVRDMNEFSKINKVYSQFMPNTLPPARVCVGINLPSEINIIMSVVAHKTVSKNQELLHSFVDSDRCVMHVQSVSHWAPANIGPYSQCIRIGEIYYLAGQIPLIPGSMEILNGTIYSQCKLTLRHVLRILEAMDKSLKFSNVLQAICYVTSETVASDVVGLWSTITKADYCTVTSVIVSGLPKNAQLEWEVLACKSINPEAEEKTEIIEDFIVHMKRCSYKNLLANSLVCKFCFSKKTLGENVKTFTPQGLNEAIDSCVKFLKADCKTGSSLCFLKFFYKKTEPAVINALKSMTYSFTDNKIAFTLIPVNGCETPEVCFTVTGVCH